MCALTDQPSKSMNCMATRLHMYSTPKAAQSYYSDHLAIYIMGKKMHVNPAM